MDHKYGSDASKLTNFMRNVNASGMNPADFQNVLSSWRERMQQSGKKDKAEAKHVTDAIERLKHQSKAHVPLMTPQQQQQQQPVFDQNTIQEQQPQQPVVQTVVDPTTGKPTVQFKMPSGANNGGGGVAVPDVKSMMDQLEAKWKQSFSSGIGTNKADNGNTSSTSTLTGSAAPSPPRSLSDIPALQGATITGIGKVYDAPMSQAEIVNLVQTVQNQLQATVAPTMSTVQNITPKLDDMKRSMSMFQSTLTDFPKKVYETRYGSPWPGHIRDPMYDRLGQNMDLYRLYQESMWKSTETSNSNRSSILLASYDPAQANAYEQFNAVATHPDGTMAFACGSVQLGRDPMTLWVARLTPATNQSSDPKQTVSAQFRLTPTDYPGMSTSGVSIQYMRHPIDSTLDWILVVAQATPIDASSSASSSNGSATKSVSDAQASASHVPFSIEQFKAAWNRFRPSTESTTEAEIRSKQSTRSKGKRTGATAGVAAQKSEPKIVEITKDDDKSDPDPVMQHANTHWVAIPLTLDLKPHPMYARTRTASDVMSQMTVVPIHAHAAIHATDGAAYDVSIASQATIMSNLTTTLMITSWTCTTSTGELVSGPRTNQYVWTDQHAWMPSTVEWKTDAESGRVVSCTAAGIDLIDNVAMVTPLLPVTEHKSSTTSFPDVSNPTVRVLNNQFASQPQQQPTALHIYTLQQKYVLPDTANDDGDGGDDAAAAACANQVCAWPVSMVRVHDHSVLVAMDRGACLVYVDHVKRNIRRVGWVHATRDQTLWKRLQIQQLYRLPKQINASELQIYTAGAYIVQPASHWYQPMVARWILRTSDAGTCTLERDTRDANHMQQQRAVAYTSTVLKSIVVTPGAKVLADPPLPTDSSSSIDGSLVDKVSVIAVGACQYATNRRDTDGYVYHG